MGYKGKLYLALLGLVSLFFVMLFNFYLLQKELGDFYSLVVKEEVEKVRSVLEGTISAGGDPVDALSYYIKNSTLLKGATLYLDGREIIVPDSQISPSYHTEVIKLPPFEFKIYIDTSYLYNLNSHIKVIFLSLIFFTLLFSSILAYFLREFYREKMELERERQESERIRSVNLAIHSILHEVKNRLNVLNLLLHRFKKSQNEEYLEKLKSELLTLNRYVEETAELRKPLKLSLKEFEACKLLKELLERLLPLAKESGVEVSLSCDECTVRGDYERLLSALTDVLKNAIEAVKEKEEKRVWIEGRCLEDSYLFRIVDSGGELPQKEELFKPFKSTKRKGFGLGLFNAKRVFNAHGGTIEAFVKDGKSHFDMKLPLKD
jgi:signal transduction histidine kinase